VTATATPVPVTWHPGDGSTVVCLALAAVVAAMSSLNVALPSVAQATHASQTQLAPARSAPPG
jgi:hypothetical protein